MSNQPKAPAPSVQEAEGEKNSQLEMTNALSTAIDSNAKAAQQKFLLENFQVAAEDRLTIKQKEIVEKIKIAEFDLQMLKIKAEKINEEAEKINEEVREAEIKTAKIKETAAAELKAYQKDVKEQLLKIDEMATKKEEIAFRDSSLAVEACDKVQ